MIVRYEKIRGSDNLIIISETEKFLGEVSLDQFISCMEDRDSFSECDYDWFYVDKNKLFSVFQSFSGEKLNKQI